jgi:hypothetical protein
MGSQGQRRRQPGALDPKQVQDAWRGPVDPKVLPLLIGRRLRVRVRVQWIKRTMRSISTIHHSTIELI